MRIRPSLLAAVALLLLTQRSVSAHLLDEYLQATTLSVGKGRVRAQLRLTPGVAVFPRVFAAIDTSRDGAVSTAEQQAYAAQVLRDLTLTVDGAALPLRLTATKFAGAAEMKQGLGDIELDFVADVPPRAGIRKLVFENHHQMGIAAYLVNCLVPTDPDVQVTAQTHSYTQSSFTLNYLQTGTGGTGWLGAGITALVLFAPFALYIKHIAPAKKK